MRITCEDQSEGRLFFAYDFLSMLNCIGQKVKLYVPDNYQTKYGNFLDYFPRIDIQLGFQNLNTTVPDIIFSNANDLHALQQIKKSLIFPILKNSEIKNYINWYNLLKDKFKQNIIPVEFKQSEKSIVQPESKWAMDMLQRQISEKPLKDISFLISAGPTIEDIDPVRYITNRSSGKMGIALARAAYLNGANVKLVIGPTSIDIPCYLKTQQIRSAEDMYHAVISHFEHCDVYIGSAAIADFKPIELKNDKIKKKDGISQLILQPTKDILKELSTIKKKQVLVGFSVETIDTIENSKAKLINKKLDLVVVNNPREKGAAFDADTNVVSVIHRDGSIQSWPIMSKLDVANKLMVEIKKKM